MLILVNNKAESPGQKRLQRSDIDLSVALAGVPVPHLKQSSSSMNRNKKLCPRNKFLVVDVAGMHPRRSTVIPSGRFGRRNAHASEKRMQRNHYARREVRHHLLSIQRNDLAASIRKIIGQKSLPNRKSVARKRNIEDR